MNLFPSKSRIVVGASLLLLGGGAWTGCHYLLVDRKSETTQDAYVMADYTLVAPKISGLVDKVLVEDNQPVKAGQAIVKIDDRDFRAALRSAEADVSAAKADIANIDVAIARQPAMVAQAVAAVRFAEADLAFARSNAARYRNLSAAGAGTEQDNQQAVSRLSQSQASLEKDAAALAATRLQLAGLQAEREKAAAALARTEAARDQAGLNLAYTVVTAPIDGVVGRRSVRPGSYIDAGSALLAVVPSSKAYVLANFQESQLRRIRSRQAVQISIDTFPGMKLRGRVESLAPATDVAFAPIQPDNATGNFTKVVQRVPVKILIEPGQDGARLLRVGMSVIPAIDVSGASANDLRGAR